MSPQIIFIFRILPKLLLVRRVRVFANFIQLGLGWSVVKYFITGVQYSSAILQLARVPHKRDPKKLVLRILVYCSTKISPCNEFN